MKHRRFATSHEHMGFQLVVTDHPMWRWLVEAAVDRLMDVTGHPCCGRWFGRIPGVASAAYLLISWAGRVGLRRHTAIVTLPLTTGQAVALNPHWLSDIGPDGFITINGTDALGDVYEDARLVAARCPRCGELVPSEGRWVRKILDEHRCAEVA